MHRRLINISDATSNIYGACECVCLLYPKHRCYFLASLTSRAATAVAAITVAVMVRICAARFFFCSFSSGFNSASLEWALAVCTARSGGVWHHSWYLILISRYHRPTRLTGQSLVTAVGT